MNQFLLHFFPQLTVFLFCMAAEYFVRYINSIQKIEKHMKSNRPTEWEALGKPNLFSGKYSEKNVQFKKFIDHEKSSGLWDTQLNTLVEKSKQLQRVMIVVTWSAFVMYIITIAAVRFFLGQIQGV